MITIRHTRTGNFRNMDADQFSFFLRHEKLSVDQINNIIGRIRSGFVYHSTYDVDYTAFFHSAD